MNRRQALGILDWSIGRCKRGMEAGCSPGVRSSQKGAYKVFFPLRFGNTGHRRAQLCENYPFPFCFVFSTY